MSCQDSIEQGQNSVTLFGGQIISVTSKSHGTEITNSVTSSDGLLDDTSLNSTVQNIVHSKMVNKSQDIAEDHQHVCDVCQKGFSSSANMHHHKEIHSRIKKFACTLCCNSYTQKQNLTKHMRTHTGEKPYRCHLCEKVFTIHHHLKNHMHMHNSPLQVVFSKYKNGFQNKSNLKADIQMRPSESNNVKSHSVFGSDDNSTSEDWDTSRDEDRFDEEDDTECDSLVYSLFNGEEQTYNVHDCNLCQLMFVSKESLENHMRVQHSVERDFKCDRCSKTFMAKENLDEHSKTHIGQQTYTCVECNVSFRWNVSLHIHMRRHNNDFRKYECSLCKKHFLAKESLRKHMNSHAGVNSNVDNDHSRHSSHKQSKFAVGQHTYKIKAKTVPTCKTCFKTFSSNSNLKKHKYTHLDIKPYKCEVCDATFAQKIQLSLHNKKHSAVKKLTSSASVVVKEEIEATQKSTSHDQNVHKCINVTKMGNVDLERRHAAKIARLAKKDSGKNEKSMEDGGHGVGKWTLSSSMSRLTDYNKKKLNGRNAARTARHVKTIHDTKVCKADDRKEDIPLDTVKKKSRWEGYRYPVCPNCSKTFKKKLALLRHLKTCKLKLST